MRNIGGTLSGDPRDIAALTPEQIKALPVEGMPPTAPSVVDTVLEAVRDVKVSFETITWHRCVDVAPIVGETVLCAFDPESCAPSVPAKEQ